jgi:hypothetical protein
MTTDPEMTKITDQLKPCPFCGKKLKVVERKYNPYAQCITEGCKGAQLPLLNIELPEDVARWNSRGIDAQHARDSAELRRLCAARDAQAVRAKAAEQALKDDPCKWSDAQVLEFLGIALRNVDLVGSINLSEIRQGFQFMRGKALEEAATCEP